MTDKLKITTEHLMSPHGRGETLLRENVEVGVFVESPEHYRSDHLRSQAEADELKIRAARKMLEEAPISPEMQRRNNIDLAGGVALIREQVLAQEKEYDPNTPLALEDIVKDNYGLAE